MACLDLNSPHILPNQPSYNEIFNLFTVGNASDNDFNLQDASKSHQSTSSSIPRPPPLPAASYGARKYSKGLKGYSLVPDETRKAWDKLFFEGYGADVRVLTDNKGIILAHSSILGIASPVLRNMLEQAKVKEGFRRIKIRGVPLKAIGAFIRFLYSSCFELDLMKEHALHLIILSHIFAIPSLKSTCIQLLEQEFLTAENVVDVLQLARLCDAPRLSFLCTRMITKYFKTISATDGWKTMKKSNPNLEQEVLEALVEEDSRVQDRVKRMEERKVYLQLHEAMEALLHICRDGCRTIGPRDKMLRDSESTCKYAACKGLESVVRHFSGCRIRVPGGCAQCKRLWQLLELHSQMCSEPDLCKVPLCRHFRDKMKHLSKKEAHKWKLLVSKVTAAKGTISSLSARRPLVP